MPMGHSIRDQPYLAAANGQLIPQQQLQVSYADLGFMMGVTVSEQLRTFNGKLFLLDEHLSRLQDSMNAVGSTSGMTSVEMAAIAYQLVEHNFQLLLAAGFAGWDLGLGIFVTLGVDGAMPSASAEGPIVGMYTYPLNFPKWAGDYDAGGQLVTVSVCQTTNANWPLFIKCRSRMHYYLATKEAQEQCPGAYPLLLNADQSISETPTANVLFVGIDGEIVSPPRNQILPGVSLAFVEELARELGLRMEFRTIDRSLPPQFSEILLSSTPFCLLPIGRFDGQVVGDGVPGPVFKRLMSSWSDRVGLDICDQARLAFDRIGGNLPPN